MTAPATLSDFKEQFDRDFLFGTGFDTVRDQDITRALLEAGSVFNAALWDTAELKPAYLYATAHFLVLNIQMAGGLTGKKAGKGAANRGANVTQSKSVGQISVQYGIAQSLLEAPALNQFLRTDYGLRYIQMIAPRLVGNVTIAAGFNDTGDPNGGI